MSPQIVDLFAGPGGWSEGLKALGYSELGVEWDEAACLTARAAGHERLQADVAAIDPIPCWGLIASPPCQAWSMAGKGGGRRDKELCVRAALELAAGNDTRAERAKECEDERSMLVVEPLRWALATRPEWIAMEQVPPVLEMWTLFAQILRQAGYSVWAGVLEAERYGVPQTRERAILMASRVSDVQPPVPTHQRYVKGEPQRHDLTMEGEVLPWVSMAEALGWSEGPAPAPAATVTGGGGAAGGVEVFASKSARKRVRESVAYRKVYGEGMTERHGDRQPVADTEPAPVITSKARSAEWVDGRSPEFHRGPIASTEPAPTIASTSRQAEWVHERPSSTVAADPRIFPPGHFHRGLEDGNTTGAGENGHPIRVTVEQASILQSFRPDYPWQGSRTKQFEQVGNAVPPKLAQAVLAALIPTAQEASRAA